MLASITASRSSFRYHVSGRPGRACIFFSWVCTLQRPLDFISLVCTRWSDARAVISAARERQVHANLTQDESHLARCSHFAHWDEHRVAYGPDSRSQGGFHFARHKLLRWHGHDGLWASEQPMVSRDINTFACPVSVQMSVDKAANLARSFVGRYCALKLQTCMSSYCTFSYTWGT